jgi:hypothetical protein
MRPPSISSPIGPATYWLLASLIGVYFFFDFTSTREILLASKRSLPASFPLLLT